MNTPLPTRPPSLLDNTLQQKLAEDIVKQNDRLDELAKQLFTLELAIPGLYATVLQLVAGEKATLAGAYLWLPFVFWFFALLATMVGLFPLRYQVHTEIVRDSAPEPGFWQGLWQWFRRRPQTLSIEGFYRRAARDKRYALLLGSFCFFAGLVSAAITIF